ncbi:hypothetical protein JHK82_048090 [Glycine max]|nr:hypothetical protein JHK82_048090 [Glycine max]
MYVSEFLFKLMARIDDKIKTIDGSKENLKLAIRITELWFVGMSGRSEQAEMVIIDSDGDKIHVVCKQEQLKTWKMDLKECCTYVMHNFRVSQNDGQYKVEVMVNYKDESTKFLSWDRECTELIGQSADEVNSLKVGDLDLNASPKALDKLLGHLLAFKVKI